MALVMAFIVSSLSQTVNRYKLPFKCLVGETYEYSDDYIKFIGECVEPDLLSFYSTNTNNDFEIYGTNFVQVVNKTKNFIYS